MSMTRVVVKDRAGSVLARMYCPGRVVVDERNGVQVELDPESADATPTTITISEADIEAVLETRLKRSPTNDEVEEAVNWLAKDFDFSTTFERIESILDFRMPQTRRLADGEEEAGKEEEAPKTGSNAHRRAHGGHALTSDDVGEPTDPD